jgi:hypothetical protein
MIYNVKEPFYQSFLRQKGGKDGDRHGGGGRLGKAAFEAANFASGHLEQ